MQVRNIKWTDMAWKSLSDAGEELRGECGRPPGFPVREKPADVFAMFDDISQPAKHWFYLAGEAVMVRAASPTALPDCLYRVWRAPTQQYYRDRFSQPR